jgi:carbon monoxide dehydrogenase subunit G
MGLRFEHVFLVKAPADRVWDYLTDPFRVAPALPGAAITEKLDDRTYAGTITVKVGPVSARYKGTARFETLDPATRTAEMVASAQDTSGRGGADMRMTSRMVERPDGATEVSVVSDVNVTGIMAQFGRGLMQDVSDQMLQRFTEAVRVELEKPVVAEDPEVSPVASPAASPAVANTPPIEVSSFVLRQPAFWVAAAVVVFAVYWLWIR